MAGKSGAAPITHFDTSSHATRFACEVKNWDASAFIDKRQLRHLDLFLQYSVLAGLLAWVHTLVRPDDLRRVMQAFNLKGWVSLCYLVFTTAAAFLA